ncbi:MAG: hypothetical protein RL095_3556 [Verrucomicrobiota bacterium]|jgi:hypothetical protein
MSQNKPQVFTLQPRSGVKFWGLVLIIFVISLAAYCYKWPWPLLVPPAILLYPLISCLIPRRFIVDPYQGMESRTTPLQHLLGGPFYGKVKFIVLFQQRGQPQALWILISSRRRILLADGHSFSTEQISLLAEFLSRHTGAKLRHCEKRR